MGQKSWHRHRINKDGDAPKKKNNTPEDHGQPPSDVSNAQDLSPETPSRKPPSSNEEHRAAERRFWDRQIVIASWLNIITAVGAIVALVGIIFLIKNIIDAENATMRANRAWIAPRGAYLDARHSSNQAKVFTIEYENVGREPATDIFFSQYADYFDGPALIDKVTYSLPIKKVDTCSVAGRSIAPAYPLNGSGSKEEVIVFMDSKEFLNDFNLFLSGKKTFYIEGCFRYKTFRLEHRSIFCYYLKPIEVSDIGKDAKLGPDGTLAPNAQIQLQIFMFSCPNSDLSFTD